MLGSSGGRRVSRPRERDNMKMLKDTRSKKDVYTVLLKRMAQSTRVMRNVKGCDKGDCADDSEDSDLDAYGCRCGSGDDSTDSEDEELTAL